MAGKRKVSFRFGISQVFVAFVLFVVVAVSVNYYLRTSTVIVDLSEEIVNRAGKVIIEQTQTFLKVPASYTRMLAGQIGRDDAILDIVAQREFLWRAMWEPLLISPQLQSFYVADEQGSYVQVRREPRLATRLIDRSGPAEKKNAVDVRYYRNADYSLLETTRKPTTFDPRIRPWYANTPAEPVISWTDIYISTTAQTPVIGAAFPILSESGDKRGVIGVNIPLHSLSDFVSNQHITARGVVLIMDSKGKLVAFPDKDVLVIRLPKQRPRLRNVAELDDPIFEALFQRYQSAPSDQSFKLKHRGEDHIVTIIDFPAQFEKTDWKIVGLIPESDLLGEVNQMMMEALIIAAGILVLAVLAIFAISAQISKPIMALARHTERIRDFELDQVAGVESRYLEVDTMSRSVVRAAQGLKAFKKYVPAELVRQLIQTHQEARLGGESAELTIMFTDVEGFATMSEGMEPEELMVHLSQYLDELTRIIMDTHGTIDKYIGDAIMAFWGAPIKQDNAPVLACTAAWRCSQRLLELNPEWRKQGLPPMTTRFGIHTGESVVGNLGSSERMNYSVIGDSVNLAARLEGVNKQYGTHILVSEDTQQQVASAFHFRAVDKVAVKGRSQGVRIYELLGPSDMALDDATAAFKATYEKAIHHYWNREWDQAERIFSELHRDRPEDPACAMFVTRCRSMAKVQDQIRPDWDGTYTLNTK